MKKPNGMLAKNKAKTQLAQRAEATQKAVAAMQTFCASVKLQWAGSEDGEAVVGYDEQQAIRSVIHLDPKNIQRILALDPKELIEHLK